MREKYGNETYKDTFNNDLTGRSGYGKDAKEVKLI